MKTMICVILDRSGSMDGRQEDVIGGVNTFLTEQKKLKQPASIAFVRFDTEAIERFREMKPLGEVDWLTHDEYLPRGGTPLLDAVGQTLAQLDLDWAKENPERAIVVIVTDGQENSSKEYTTAKIKEMIKARQDSGKWAFIYLGADVDAFAEAQKYGIPMQNAAGYVKSAAGIRGMSASMSASVGNMRVTGQSVADLGGNIQEDGSLKKDGAWDVKAVNVQIVPTTTGSAGTVPKIWSTPQTRDAQKS
jgi:uncharacterized protein YegL